MIQMSENDCPLKLMNETELDIHCGEYDIVDSIDIGIAAIVMV